MGDSSHTWGQSGDIDVVELTGKVMVVAIILLFFVLVFFFCLHLYAKWFWYRHERNATATTNSRRRRRFDFAAGHQEIIVEPCSRIGLDPCVLKNIPVIVFKPNEFKDGLECAVCLCEVCGGEKARILPKCNHGFHIECIDMWFQSHSTCPLCRNPVADEKQSSSVVAESTLEDIIQAPIAENSDVSIYSTEAPSFPTNVFLWGDETQVRASSLCMEEDHQGSPTAEPSSPSSSPSMVSTSNRLDGLLVIDIPTQNNEEEEQKSPVPTRVRSLKRLLSGTRKADLPSPRNMDLEHGSGQS